MRVPPYGDGYSWPVEVPKSCTVYVSDYTHPIGFAPWPVVKMSKKQLKKARKRARKQRRAT